MVSRIITTLIVMLSRHPAICSGVTGIRIARFLSTALGAGCLLWCVTAPAQDLAGQTYAANQAQTTTLPTVTVEEKALDDARAQISPSLGATSYTLDSEKIDSQSQGEFASFDQTFYRFPGVAQDELDKRLHVRGEENNLQYRVNGILLPDGLTGFGQEFSSKFLDSVSLITGTLPAQYGDRTAGIVDIQTKNGQDMHGGTISLYGGGYGTVMPSIEYGGSSGNFSGYGMLSFLHDGLGMSNPTSTFRPNHDDTEQYKGFGNFSYLIDSTSRLTLILSSAYGSFQLPTQAGQTPQFPYGSITAFNSNNVNENQYEQAHYEVLAYQKSMGDVDLQLTQTTRYSNVSFKPDTVADVIFNGIATDTSHQLVANNLQFDVSDRVNERHTVRSGLFFSLQEARVNSTNTVLPVLATGYGQPESIVDNYHKTAELYSVYLQDEWRLTPKLTVNYGLRADLWDAFITEGQVSPRINFVYKPLPATTLHAGYGRYFTPPPLELIQSGDVAKFNGTTNAVPLSLQSNASAAVRSERYHYFDVGVNQDITSHFHVGLDGYYKLKKYTLDEGQFGPAMIFSPDNSARGYVVGVEATFSYEKDGVALWGNAARSQAMAKGMTTGQWQFDPTEVAYLQTHWYHLDHDQNWTASAGGSYKWAQYKTKVYADVLYGSGLYSGFCNETEMPSYATLNMGMTQIVSINPGNDFKLRLDVTNVTDVKYQIRQGTEDNPNAGIGVFAPQYLPRRAVYVGISKDF